MTAESPHDHRAQPELTVPAEVFDISWACAATENARRTLLRLLCKLPVRTRCRLYGLMDDFQHADRELAKARRGTRSAGFTAADYLLGEDNLVELDDDDQNRTAAYDFAVLYGALRAAIAAAYPADDAPIAVRRACVNARQILVHIVDELERYQRLPAAPRTITYA